MLLLVWKINSYSCSVILLGNKYQDQNGVFIMFMHFENWNIEIKSLH